MGQRLSHSDNSAEDGSQRDRITNNKQNARTVDHYVAPLRDDSSCPVLEMPRNIFEIIFAHLSLVELSQLSQSCRSVNLMVGEYLRHECCSAAAAATFRQFVAKHDSLLTMTERWIVEDINKHLHLAASADDEDIPRLAQYKLLNTLEMFKVTCRRISVCDDAVGFPHRGNPQYVPIKHNEELGRNMACVQDVCWLAIDHEFPEVEPGRYSVSLRARIHNLRWPHTDTQTTQFSLEHPGAGHMTDSWTRSVTKLWWKTLAKGETPSEDGANTGLSVTWESGRVGTTEFTNAMKSVGFGFGPSDQDDRYYKTGWFSITLSPFTVSTRGSVHFQMKDVECPWWKSGLWFDFIQLTREA